MKTFMIVACAVALMPTAALAEAADGDRHDDDTARVIEESYASMRDGRLMQALEEQRANKEAFEAYRLRGMQEPTATGSVSVPRR